MYESPIKIIQGQMETSLENDIMSVVQRYGIDVNKDALICALQYDRNQYDKGYAEGREDGKREILNKLVHILSDYSVPQEIQSEEYFMGKTTMNFINTEYFKELFEDSCVNCPFYGSPDLRSECDSCKKKRVTQ